MHIRTLGASAHLWGDLLRWLYSPTISMFLLTSTVTSVESLTCVSLDRWQTMLKIHHASANGNHLSALKVWNDCNMHLFIYSIPSLICGVYVAPFRWQSWEEKTSVFEWSSEPSQGKLWAILHLEIRIMGAQVGQAEKRGFQTGQLRGKLIWESTKGWWDGLMV